MTAYNKRGRPYRFPTNLEWQAAERIADLAVRAIAPASVNGKPMIDVLRAHDRREPLSSARLAAMALCRTEFGFSLGIVGRLFHRDHNCVVSAVYEIEDRCETEPAFKETYERIKQSLL